MVVAIIALLVVVGGIGLAHYDALNPPKTESLEVIPSLGPTNLVEFNFSNGNCTATPIPGRACEVPFLRGMNEIDVTAINNGNAPVYLTAVSMSTNVTSSAFESFPVPTANATLAPGQGIEFGIPVNSTAWPLDTVKAHFVVTGVGVTQNANLTLLVGTIGTPSSSTTTTSSSSTAVSSSSSAATCRFDELAP